MRFTISGFGGASQEGQETPAAREAEPVSAAPRKSVVQVCFPETGRSLAYYNDRFNLKAGTYDKKKVYRLVIANDIDVEEIEFHIDIAFADDFGFDL